MTKITDFKPQQKNANKHTPYGLRLLEKSVQEDGWLDGQTAAADGEMISGSARLELAAEKFADVEPIIVHSDGSRPVLIIRDDILNADTERARRLSVAANKIAAVDFDPDFAILQEWAGEDEQIKKLFSDDEWLKGTGEEPSMADAEPQIDKAAELQEKWQTASGQLWQLGDHRLLIGDCTVRENVERLMGGENAVLLHADPPYGMGKENEGIKNDNLYCEKLDKFQIEWWQSCRPSIANNGSVYIWGTAESLWRLWYSGLEKSERLTFRNEIVWNKGNGQGMGSDTHRQYPTASERCLFFVVGEQGWNNNADNYWDGFTPIVKYLDSQRAAMNWSIKDTKRIAGHSEKSGCHWFDKSQWTMPTEEVYNAWKAAANNDAFSREYDALSREYDDLRREWYATRATFDNTHELMTDVWSFDTMRGEDRPNHPTPKPLEIMTRIIKTSATDDGVTLDPFLGSGSTLIAGHSVKRRVYGLELSEKYGAVILQRFFDATGITPELVE